MRQRQIFNKVNSAGFENGILESERSGGMWLVKNMFIVYFGKIHGQNLGSGGLRGVLMRIGGLVRLYLH